ncbi:hypothetical protein LCGC14_0405280 [marine sediment metagenome]|uniref:Acb2/Tad1 hairpin domain-containing protein n=1 Tax=marine sediment metagenome TaxID=412755 RepID=A0A0F9T149_9ZZZZ
MASNGFKFENSTDEDGNPTGGFVDGMGIYIRWQDGPLNRGKDRLEPNGALVEDVIKAAKFRIEHYNESKFKGRENSMAITKLDEALLWLDKRMKDRERRGVAGTHEV